MNINNIHLTLIKTLNTKCAYCKLVCLFTAVTGVRGTCTCVHTLSEMAAQVPLLSYDALQAYFGLGLCSNLT